MSTWYDTTDIGRMSCIVICLGATLIVWDYRVEESTMVVLLLGLLGTFLVVSGREGVS